MIYAHVSQQLPLLWAVCTSYELLFSSYFISEACLNNNPLEDSTLHLFLLFAVCRQHNISGPSIERKYASSLHVVSFLNFLLKALRLRPCLLSPPQLWLQIWTTVLIISLMINPDIRLSARSRSIATRLWPALVWILIRNLFWPCVHAQVIAFGMVLENSSNYEQCINTTTQLRLPQILMAY